jgi:DNA polymerase epsilon subunit 1
MDLYFIDREGANFKASIIYDPYFFVDIDDSSRYLEVSNFLARKYEGCYTSIVEKEDLDLPNHLAGIKRKLIKISFNTVSDLIETKSKLRPIIEQNKKKQKSISIEDGKKELVLDPLMCLIDMREYDVPYVMRVSIDLDIRVGAWYIVTPQPGVEVCSVDWQKDFLELCEPKVLAFDIECEKSPLKFPNSETDKIFMISYMTPNQGYLIINREVVSKDIEDFEYTPKPSFPGIDFWASMNVFHIIDLN